MLCILWLRQDIEVNRRRVATCSSAQHVSNSHNCFRLDPAYTFNSQSFHSACLKSRQPSLHPGSSTANLFNSVCPALAPSRRLDFTLQFNNQSSLLCCAPSDCNEYHSLAIHSVLSRPHDSLVQLINLSSLFVHQTHVGSIVLPFISLRSSTLCHLPLRPHLPNK